MRVTFLLPGRALRYSGGFTVVYRHAQGLATRGHEVALVHVPYLDIHAGPVDRLRALGVYGSGALGLRRWSPHEWLTPVRGATPLWRPAIANRTMPDADALVVSHWHSALRARSLAPSKGRKFYLVQEYELFMSAGDAQRDLMREAYAAPYRVIPISSAVASMLRECGAAPEPVVPDGLDHETFGLTRPIADRTPLRVGFCWRPEPFKGTSVAVEALERVRAEIPSLSVWAYGASDGGVPSWVELIPRPSDAQLADAYNRTSVFVMASDYEGWGLPGAEALACGAALATTDSGGVLDYARHEVTALVSPRRDAGMLAANVLRLLRDASLRQRLARAGREHVRQFTWPHAVARLEQVLSAATPAN